MTEGKKKSGKKSGGKNTGTKDNASQKPDEAPQGFEYKRLYRSRSTRMIAGVCGGIAEYFEIDPTLVRILFVVSCFAGGLGLWAYIIGWIVIPESETNSVSTVTASKAPLFGIIVGVVLVLIGFGMFLEKMSYWFFWPGFVPPLFSWESFFALILIGLGVFLVMKVMHKDKETEIASPGIKAGRHSLYRSKTSRKLSGVCGGIGEYFSIDPTIVRILWVVGTLVSHILPGLIVYIVMVFIVPESPAVQEESS